MWKLIRRSMPFIFGFGLVLATVLLLMPNYAVPKAFDFWDKAQHGLMFTALAIAGLMAYPQHAHRVIWGLVIYGGLMEVCQSTLTTTRHGEWLDWLTDGVGIVLGCGIFKLVDQFYCKLYYKYNSNKII